MGRAIALQYAQAGAAVAAVDVDGQTAQETSAAIEAAGGRSLPIQADVEELASIDRMVQQIGDVRTVGRHGEQRRGDALSEHHGGHRGGLGPHPSGERQGRVFLHAAGGATDDGARPGGRIVNIASIAGKGYAGTSNAAYAASKGAVT